MRAAVSLAPTIPENVYRLPVTIDHYGQILRMPVRWENRSVLHILMNPNVSSAMHEHSKTREIHIITQGSGNLTHGEWIYSVKAGDVIEIPANTRHRIVNTGIGNLERLVLSHPSLLEKDLFNDPSWEDPRLPEPPPISPYTTAPHPRRFKKILVFSLQVRRIRYRYLRLARPRHVKDPIVRKI